jgi:hypothetical protein
MKNEKWKMMKNKKPISYQFYLEYKYWSKKNL